jgi:broad specificity phosphatase PhoE
LKLFIARHAESSFNALGQKTGGDPSLSLRGMKQAQALANALQREEFSRIISSPSKRALETAEEVAKGKIKVETRDCLREIDFGKLSGMGHDEIECNYPGLIESIFKKPMEKLPSGESIQDLAKRLTPLVKELNSAKGNPTVLIVAHNITNRVLISLLLGVPLSSCRVFKQKNASLALLDSNEKQSYLVSLNNSIHGVK